MVRNGKRWCTVLFALLTALTVMTLVPTRVYAAAGWQSSGGKWYYYTNSKTRVKDTWYRIGGKWYRFDKSGAMLTGWYSEKQGDDYGGYSWTNWYYLGRNGAATGWRTISGTKYYFDEDPEGPPWMYHSIRTEIGGNEYYFASSGAVQTGWIKESWVETGKRITFWYYGKPSGVLVTGWQKLDGTWYYFGDDHIMDAGYAECIDGNWYGFKSSGAMATGWYSEQPYGTKTVNWYFMNSSGVAQRGWHKIGGSWYYFEKNKDYAPIMYSNGLYKIGGKYYYFNKGGDMAIGWKKISGKYYYFDGSGAMVRSRWVGNYYLGSDGAMLTDTVTPDGYRVGANGKWDGKPKVAA